MNDERSMNDEACAEPWAVEENEEKAEQGMHFTAIFDRSIELRLFSWLRRQEFNIRATRELNRIRYNIVPRGKGEL